MSKSKKNKLYIFIIIYIKKKNYKYKYKLNKLKGGEYNLPINLSGLNNLTNCNLKDQLLYNKIPKDLIEVYSEYEKMFNSNSAPLDFLIKIKESNQTEFDKYKKYMIDHNSNLISNITICAKLSDKIYTMNSEENLEKPNYKYIIIQNSLIIICKGTSMLSLSDILIDLNTGYITNFHNGMFKHALKILFRTNFNKNYFQQMTLHLPPALDIAMCNTLFDLIKEFSKPKKSIILTGHSLGAATCIYMLIILMFENVITEENNIQLYLYGSPPVIPPYLVNTISKFIINVRVLSDPVTNASLKLENPCFTLILDEKDKTLELYNTITDKLYSSIFDSNINNHYMPYYIKILENVTNIKIKQDNT